jgi:hypothetical protein
MSVDFTRLLVICAFFSVLAGCGPKGRPTVPTALVSGVVKMDGQPLAGAQVNFLNTDYAGVADTDASGRFEMTAQPGSNKVFIVKYQGASGSFDATMIGGGDMAGSGPKQLLPPKFSDPGKSELTFTVSDEGNSDANFEVTSK